MLGVGVNSLLLLTLLVETLFGTNTKGIRRVGTNNLPTQTVGANNIGTNTVINNTNYVGAHSIKPNYICYQRSLTLSP